VLKCETDTCLRLLNRLATQAIASRIALYSTRQLPKPAGVTELRHQQASHARLEQREWAQRMEGQCTGMQGLTKSVEAAESGTGGSGAV
jgi:hypothetical protein